ncbi:unnamed protein product [Calypogeia fissa]
MAVLKSKPIVSPAHRKRKVIEGENAAETYGKPVDSASKKRKVNDLKKPAAGKFVKSKSDAAKAEKPLDRKARKELAEYRKKKRKPNYDLEKEVKILWEKMRQRNLEKEERSKLVSETLKKMKGKLVEMGGSHIASRVLQACVKYCQQSERDAVFEELRPHALTLARNTYAYHLVIKMLDLANKTQLSQMLSTLHGHVVSLLRHPVGSAVVEHAYQLANGAQKRDMVSEFYSPEYRLFKGLTGGKCGLPDLLAKESVSKQNSMLQHMMLSLQPILEKGIIDHSITHRVLVEYLSVCKQTMVEDVVKSLSGPLLVRMIHTKDGAKVGVTCVKQSSAKERKNIIRGMKGHVSKIAQHEHSSIVLLAILDVVDDTKLVSKIISTELLKDLKDLTSHKYGRRCFLHLLAPGTTRYFPSDVLAALGSSMATKLQDEPADTSTGVGRLNTVCPPVEKMVPKVTQGAEKSVVEGEEEDTLETEGDNDSVKEVRGISKKDPSLRRFELLSTGGLGKKLVEICTEQANELLQSPTGTDVIYEVARGGVDGVMWDVVFDEVLSLHRAIAALAAKSRELDSAGQGQTEHVLEQYHASRTIRRLIINSESSPKGKDAPSFAATLWTTALRKKCSLWAKGHSAKVISAYTTCGDASTKEAAKKEVQGLIDTGVLKQS